MLDIELDDEDIELLSDLAVTCHTINTRLKSVGLLSEDEDIISKAYEVCGTGLYKTTAMGFIVFIDALLTDIYTTDDMLETKTLGDLFHEADDVYQRGKDLH